MDRLEYGTQKKGGPNWAENWCIAPVIVDEHTSEVYYTPLYYTLAHFSKYIRPGDKRIGCKASDSELSATATINDSGEITVVIFNSTEQLKSFSLYINGQNTPLQIQAQAIQTILIESEYYE